ncbi:MAG TPA: DEAD/DEAH box helicase [Thermodesulfovibrionia bacterium]|nr:DEAD/DEAH box helicase [Thermodesulfovibrionia bacterium]
MQVTVTVDNLLRLRMGELSPEVINKLKSQLVFINPKWIENEKRGYWTGDIPHILSFFNTKGDKALIPRGFASRCIQILSNSGLNAVLDDKTRQLPDVPFTFQADLRSFQAKAVTAILSKRFGVLNAPTGSGKTVMALKVIAERKQPALVVVHTKELLYQWRDRTTTFLGIPQDEVGLIGDGKKQTGSRITIAIVNSLYKCLDEVANQTGFLVVDECHRTPAKTFTEAVEAFDSRYMLGLSATPYRRDGLTKVIHFYLGNTVYDISARELQKQNQIMEASLVARKTGFDYNYQDDYQEMLSRLVDDPERNQLIAHDVVEHVTKEPGIALVLSDRKNHCRTLFDLIVKQNVTCRLLTGEVSAGERKSIVEELNQGKVRVLVATAQLIGEGFDLKALSSIFMATPVKFSGRVKQYIGRILRMAHGKTNATIYDYLDEPGVLLASFKTRVHVYRELGVPVDEQTSFLWE